MKVGVRSEEIASSILESLGYTIVERKKQVIVDGSKVTEIDIIARSPENEIVSVEVKSGKASVTDVRQAFSNAKLINAKPLLICKGFSDQSALLLAKELNVSYIFLPEYYLFTLEDFKEIAEEVLLELINFYLSTQIDISLSEDELNVISSIASSNSFKEAAEKLGIREEELGQIISTMSIFKKKKRSYNFLKFQSLVVLNRIKEREKLNEIDKKLTEVIFAIKELRGKVS